MDWKSPYKQHIYILSLCSSLLLPLPAVSFDLSQIDLKIMTQTQTTNVIFTWFHPDWTRLMGSSAATLHAVAIDSFIDANGDVIYNASMVF